MIVRLVLCLLCLLTCSYACKKDKPGVPPVGFSYVWQKNLRVGIDQTSTTAYAVAYSTLGVFNSQTGASLWVTNDPDVQIRFYYAPWTQSVSKNVDFVVVQHDDKTASATHDTPPLPTDNFGGLTITSMKDGRPSRCTVWLNTFVLTDGVSAMFQSCTLHELGHVLGAQHSTSVGHLMNPVSIWKAQTKFHATEIALFKSAYK